VVVGAPTGGPGGRVYIFHGKKGGAPDRAERLMQTGQDEPGDLFGATLLAVDLDSEPGQDLMIGTPHERPYGNFAPMSGEVYLRRHEKVKESTWNDLVDFTLAPSADLDEFGASLAAADVDRDGRIDLFVGTPGYDASGQHDSGAVFQFERDNGAFPGRRFIHQDM
jgi:hypothetical protein